MTKKLTYDEVKNFIEEQGYKLLSEDYKNNITKLEIKCPRGHIFWKSYNNFKKGQRCKYCREKDYVPYNKYSYNFIKRYIELYNYKLLSENYDNSKEKLKLKCPDNHIFEISFHDFKRGNRCRYCSIKANSNKRKRDYEYIKLYFEFFGYQLLSDKYINNSELLSSKCPQGHLYQVRFKNFKKGHRCPYCFGNVKNEYEEVKKYIEAYGYKLLSKKYINNNKKLKIKCDKNHIFEMSLSNLKSGYRCSICNWSSSKEEKEIFNYVNLMYGGKIKPNDRDTIINPNTGYNLELDIYLPEINKAIEYNGEYWHSFPDRKERDLIKEKECKKRNVDLLVIGSKDFINNKDLVYTKIKNFILGE